jgi:orotidine-5'-phosphate decarboxylase
MTFRDKVENAWRSTNSLLCVGLDPEPALLPDGFGSDDVARFNIAIIEATSDLVCAYKPNAAFYEGLGPERGYAALRQTLAAIPPHIVTIFDAKRGDVEHTARAYVRAAFDDLGFDCATVNAYLGRDSVEPWIEDPDHGAIIVTRTSNPGAPDLQDVEVADGARPVYEVVAERARSWDTYGNVCLVTGATYPQEMRRLRELCPDMAFLVPGIGAQAGALDEAVRAGLDRKGAGLFVSASRGVTYASRGADFAEAARREALRLRDEINIVRAQLAPAGG